MPISEVLDNLFISGADALTNDDGIGLITRRQVKTILCLSIAPACLDSFLQLADVDYQFLYMLDTDNQNIFIEGLLERALALIEESVSREEAILVHCESGVSRCSTVVLAYLMRRFSWSLEEALLFLCQKHSIACPNPSFLRQLHFFELVGCVASPERLKRSPLYRNFAFNNPKLFQFSQGDPTATYGVDESRAISFGTKYSCKKCRKELFFDSNVLDHPPESGIGTFCTFKYLLTPMEWMQLDQYRGKINCPGCHLKIGNFVWGGQQCRQRQQQQEEKEEEGQSSDPRTSTICGQFVQPWVNVQAEKIDAFHLIVSSRNVVEHSPMEKVDVSSGPEPAKIVDG